MTKKKLVLIAGKDPVLEPLEETFKKSGFAVLRKDNAFEALCEYANCEAVAVVVGPGMTELRNYQLACLIKASGKTPVPVVVIGSENEPGSHNHFWRNADLADIHLDSLDESGIDNLAADVTKLVNSASGINGGAVGAKTDKDDCYLSTLAKGPHDNYLHLIDDLLIERLMGQISRSLIDVVEPRNQFLDQYFKLVGSIFDCQILGLSVLSSNRPWLAIKANSPISQKSMNDLLANTTRQLGASKELHVDIVGDVVEKGGSLITATEILPVVADRVNLGAVVFATTDKGGFEEDSKKAMHHLRRLILPVMRLLLASQEIEGLYQKEMYRTSTDASTGLYNLEFLVGFLQQQLLFSYRQKSPVGLLIVDIDNLKSINDEFGYQIGDLVLSKVANKLLSMTRASDLIGRYGGDEFAVVMPNSEITGARVLAEKIRLEIPQLSFVLPGQKKSPHVTVSVGCAAFNMEDLNPETILRDAKHALQRAKSAGGNRVSA